MMPKRRACSKEIRSISNRIDHKEGPFREDSFREKIIWQMR